MRKKTNNDKNEYLANFLKRLKHFINKKIANWTYEKRHSLIFSLNIILRFVAEVKMFLKNLKSSTWKLKLTWATSLISISKMMLVCVFF